MKRPSFSLIVRIVLALIPSSIAGRWWQKATYDFTDFDRSKPDDVTHRDVLTPEQLKHYTQEAKIRFVDVIQAYNNRDKIVNLTAEELKFAKGRVESYEKLAELHTSRGFYAAAFKDHATDKIIMAIAGGDFSEGPMPLIRDMDDMFMSTSGGPISQLPDAIKFAEDVQRQCGRIDIIAGHSMAAYLGLYLIGSGKCPNARCFAYDPPNVTNSMIDNCAELGDISKSEVKKNLRTKCMTVSITPNCYNNLGAPAGISLVSNNEPNPLNYGILPHYYVIIPRMHIYADDEFIAALEQAQTLIQRTDDGTSRGPATLTTLLLLTSILCFSPEIYRGVKRTGSASRA